MRRLVVNDALSQLGEVTMWHRLMEWLGADFVGGDYATLADKAKVAAKDASLIVRNATWFPPIETDVPTISLLQDIVADGEMRKMQETVMRASKAVVFNSGFTASKYLAMDSLYDHVNIPLPVDFSLFTPQDSFACQQALSLPDGCVCWIGASQGAAGHVKGFDIFLQIVRLNPDIPFVSVFKDAPPEHHPPNLRHYTRLSHAELVKVIGACRVGLCTSRTESQHLAGIEMGACGLPLVVPPVGCYWKREAMRGRIVEEGTAEAFSLALRAMLAQKHDAAEIRDYWKGEFHHSVIRAAWAKLIEEVECAGRS
jgi:glycosyltransferase involved in cell wall biosynthesis